jgi:hypothetical protein
MGSDPSTSVTDPWGRTHDHENLFVGRRADLRLGRLSPTAP